MITSKQPEEQLTMGQDTVPEDKPQHNEANTRDLAFEDFKAGMKYKDIAAKYNVSLSAVKSWASRHWNKQKDR